ncbi:MAG: ATP-binding cassette domain-containing protein, partial [Clostridiales bacterium]|nr:ATP-binding cassette domain-containing protein [Clostridiales bacterium]
MQQVPAVRMENITKTFKNIKANDSVTLEIYHGEILSLLGENGSGKTTLMNMLSGIYYPESGKIYIDGKEEAIRSPKDAYRFGIGMVHQHFKLVDVFTAAENIMLGIEDEGKRFNKKAVTDKIKDICDRYGFDVDPNQKVYDMNVSQKQTLEIVKTIYRGANLLILDEPTAVLTPQETEKLFSVIRNMKEDGKAVVIITHKLHEVLGISDRVAILRKGRYIDAVKTSEADELSLTEMMVGKKVSLDIDRSDPVSPEKRIVVKDLSCRNSDGVDVLKNVSFTAYSGEILGIAGISGCGQKELLESIAGLQVVKDGSSIV